MTEREMGEVSARLTALERRVDALSTRLRRIEVALYIVAGAMLVQAAGDGLGAALFKLLGGAP